MVDLDASAALLARTANVDEMIASRWARLPGVALVAVGGYGRSELFPYSDIDLLVLSLRDDLQNHLPTFLSGLWDAGLRVSHSVRSPAECISFVEKDVELGVSLLDRRFLLGDEILFAKLRDPAREHLTPELVRLTRERHAKYGNTVFHLEPNVKDSPGALRDLHVLRWLARLQGRAAPEIPHGLLFEIRSLLHHAAGRDQNILNFAQQDACAHLLELTNPEHLMGAYYRDAASLFRVCQHRLDQAESRRSPLFAGVRDRFAKLSNTDFSVINGQVYFRTQRIDEDVLVRLFQFVARHGLPLASDTEDRVRQCGAVAITWERLEVILKLPHVGKAARAMHNTGFLSKLFPDLQAIESLVIRDYYHRYTVDEHTLVAIEEAIKLRDSTDAFGELARETSDYSLLLLALLFHDSGKGAASGSHAEKSVLIASRAFTTLRMSAKDKETVLFLVRAHLDMSHLMLTRDLSDPRSAAALAQEVKTPDRLKLLTVLTYCDIAAVNPEALTPWRATLLWRLYLVTARHLTRALQSEIAEDGMPTRYGLTHSAAEIESHRRMEVEGRMSDLERIEGAYRLTVVVPDQPALFARISGALAGFGMNILRAEAYTNERKTAINTFCFVDPMRTLELNPTEETRLQQTVRDAISGRRPIENLLRARAGAPGNYRLRPPHVSFDNSASARATLFEITAEDRPGLLFDLARLIAAYGCNIEVVLVDTEGRKAIDVFYVTQNGNPLLEEDARILSVTLREAAV